jgi:hypothetical protein
MWPAGTPLRSAAQAVDGLCRAPSVVRGLPDPGPLSRPRSTRPSHQGRHRIATPLRPAGTPLRSATQAVDGLCRAPSVVRRAEPRPRGTRPRGSERSHPALAPLRADVSALAAGTPSLPSSAPQSVAPRATAPLVLAQRNESSHTSQSECGKAHSTDEPCASNHPRPPARRTACEQRHVHPPRRRADPRLAEPPTTVQSVQAWSRPPSGAPRVVAMFAPLTDR